MMQYNRADAAVAAGGQRAAAPGQCRFPVESIFAIHAHSNGALPAIPLNVSSKLEAQEAGHRTIHTGAFMRPGA